MFVRQLINIMGNLKKSFSLVHLTCILVHDLVFTTLVGLQPRVYFTLTNFRGGQGPLAPPPQYANGMHSKRHSGMHQIASFLKKLPQRAFPRTF